ncbi:GNAT family N-acetyltransferase [Geomesophilobacter sediminis]|uniref:GNAT family N-acetyltransferase n=1 Tax=Geomesophilobacter sediminis TaxID=2798584 RepID=A0A8J7JCY1_9BACT|nr:GNAT family N-acetyltransferase [Geomesophilobacter sediminis]MBJ6723159.1 GNAT family N-acetyltransferase [Geomesophilobacter sediminis]
MHVPFEKAVEVFSSLPAEKRFASNHPCYVVTDAFREDFLRPVFFVYTEGEETYYHGFHLAPVLGTELNDIQSPYGYGGPVATTAERGFLERAWSSHVTWCKKNNVLAEFIRFHPLLENWQYYQGDVVNDRETVWIDLASPDILMSYQVRARTAVKKAVKNGLYVEWHQGEHMAELFSDCYLEAMCAIGADTSYFFNLDYFRKLLQWEGARLAVCKLQDQLLAVAIFLVEEASMEYHLSGATSCGKKLAATNLILHEAALLGQRIGCRSLHLGGGNDCHPDNPLLFFKSGFSEKRSLYKIGLRVHLEGHYASLKSDWLEKGKEIPKKFLFYRF